MLRIITTTCKTSLPCLGSLWKAVTSSFSFPPRMREVTHVTQCVIIGGSGLTLGRPWLACCVLSIGGLYKLLLWTRSYTKAFVYVASSLLLTVSLPEYDR